MTHVAYRAGLAFYHDLGCEEGLLCFSAVGFSTDLLPPSSVFNNMGKRYGRKREEARRGQQDKTVSNGSSSLQGGVKW